MTINKTIQVVYQTGALDLTINVLGLDGVTSVATALPLSETAAGSTVYQATLEDEVTKGTYRVVLLRAASPIGSYLCDLDEAVGLYQCVDGPTSLQASVNVPAIENQVYLVVTPEMIAAWSDPSTIPCKRGDTLFSDFTLGTITGWSKLIFTAKAKASDTDAKAIIQVVALSGGGGGLQTLNGAAATYPTDAAMVVNDVSTGEVAMTIKARATKELAVRTLFWDCQVIYSSGDVSSPVGGQFSVVIDITQAIS